MAISFPLGCFGWKPSRMPETKDDNTRVWLLWMKIILTVVSSIAAFDNRKRYLFVKGHEELTQSPPYNKHVELSMFMTYIGLIVDFPWALVSGLLTVNAKGLWFIPVGLVDLALAVTVSIGLGMQGDFLPAKFKSCEPLQVSEQWQVIGDAKSFFVLSYELGIGAKKGGNINGPVDACKWYVKSWNLGVASNFLQWIVAYVGVFSDSRETSILNPFRPLFMLIVAIVVPPVWFCVQAAPRIRFVYHYIVKLYRHSRASKTLGLPDATPYMPRHEHVVYTSNPNFHRILNIEHVLLNVVKNLHYEDVINLSLSSKATREAVFPSRDLVYRVPKLKEYCCEKSTKRSCLYCNKKICTPCWSRVFYPVIPGYQHVTHCRPYCSKCYYKQFARHPRGYKKPCKCATSDPHTELQHICKTCSLRDKDDLKATRQKRYEQECRDLALGKCSGERGETKVKCGGCKKDFDSRTRFWVCGKCKGECRDAIHPSFVKKRAQRDAEKGEEVGEDGGQAAWWKVL